MKTALLVVSALFIGIASFAQSATVTTDHKLLIPGDSNDKVFNISKTEFGTIRSCVSKQGEIQSYTISFKMDESYFTKSMTSADFDANVASKITALPTGTKIYFEHITIKAFTNPAVSKTTAQFVLTD